MSWTSSFSIVLESYNYILYHYHCLLYLPIFNSYFLVKWAVKMFWKLPKSFLLACDMSIWSCLKFGTFLSFLAFSNMNFPCHIPIFFSYFFFERPNDPNHATFELWIFYCFSPWLPLFVPKFFLCRLLAVTWPIGITPHHWICRQLWGVIPICIYAMLKNGGTTKDEKCCKKEDVLLCIINMYIYCRTDVHWFGFSVLNWLSLSLFLRSKPQLWKHDD